MGMVGRVEAIVLDRHSRTVGADIVVGGKAGFVDCNILIKLKNGGVVFENAIIDDNGVATAKVGSLKTRVVTDIKNNGKDNRKENGSVEKGEEYRKENGSVEKGEECGKENEECKLADVNINNAGVKDVFIMHEDDVVLAFNLEKGDCHVVNEKRLPFGLQGAMMKLDNANSGFKKEVIVSKNNYNHVVSWLAGRILPLSRKNAKWLRNLLFDNPSEESGNSSEESDNPSEDNDMKAKIAIICRAVSVSDNYWLKVDGDTVKWENIDARRNQLNEVIAQMALHGKPLPLHGSVCSPEFTTNGSYAKAWKRYPDGRLWLYKAGANGSWESKVEAMCSRLLDKMNVSHCYYRMCRDDELDVCACPSVSSDELSIVDGMTMVSYCNRHGLNYDAWIANTDKENLYKMWIVDYLICNRDRHGQNYGFYYDSGTMDITGMHPLFDHNNAFDLDFMKNREADYQFGSGGIRKTAKYAMKRVDFYFEMPILASDFLTERQYKEFMWRANDLGVRVVYNPVWVKYCKKLGIVIEDSTEEFNTLHDKYELADSSKFYELVEKDYLA